MSATRLANRYAKSLFTLAVERNELADVINDIHLLNIAADESRDFYTMLKSPIIHADKKMGIMNTLFKDKINETTYNFIEILIRKGREAYLPEVIDSFIVQYNTHKHITPVTLITAQPVSAELQNEIINRLKSTAKLQDIELKTKVDESLIGGYILQYDDKMLDTSIARGMAILKDEFDNNDYVKKF